MVSMKFIQFNRIRENMNFTNGKFSTSTILNFMSKWCKTILTAIFEMNIGVECAFEDIQGVHEKMEINTISKWNHLISSYIIKMINYA